MQGSAFGFTKHTASARSRPQIWPVTLRWGPWFVAHVPHASAHLDPSAPRFDVAACHCGDSGADGCRPTRFEPMPLRLRVVDLRQTRSTVADLLWPEASALPNPLSAPSFTAPTVPSIAALITNPQEVPHA